MKNSSRGNFFSLPNEVFLLGLSAGELAVYSFLKRCENRKTHQCWPSIKTISNHSGPRHCWDTNRIDWRSKAGSPRT